MWEEEVGSRVWRGRRGKGRQPFDVRRKKRAEERERGLKEMILRKK